MSSYADTAPAQFSVPRVPTEVASEPLPVGRPVAPDPSEARFAGRDSYAVTAMADMTDRSLHAAIARFTAGLSPAALVHAYLDWATHLAYAPGKRLQCHDRRARTLKAA